MAEGLDNNFVNYGIRHDDLNIIQALCQQENINFEWLKDKILKEYHKRKVTNIDISDTDTVSIINKALQFIDYMEE
ncbi:MAG: hypothetical protein LKE54_00200 [Prevotella sp.]|jgi:hypothetical protein|nr:hypothetical protein [Prevotella sp.]MCH3993488.1 hypothetical protein [Prevotella sp.]